MGEGSGRGSGRVGSGQTFCRQSRVGSGRVNVSPCRVGSGPGKVTREQLWNCNIAEQLPLVKHKRFFVNSEMGVETPSVFQETMKDIIILIVTLPVVFFVVSCDHTHQLSKFICKHLLCFHYVFIQCDWCI